MKTTPFLVKSGRKAEDGTHIPAQFLCPKCECDDVSITFVAGLERLVCICRRCGYQQTREPLDGD